MTRTEGNSRQLKKITAFLGRIIDKTLVVLLRLVRLLLVVRLVVLVLLVCLVLLVVGLVMLLGKFRRGNADGRP